LFDCFDLRRRIFFNERNIMKEHDCRKLKTGEYYYVKELYIGSKCNGTRYRCTSISHVFVDSKNFLHNLNLNLLKNYITYTVIQTRHFFNSKKTAYTLPNKSGYFSIYNKPICCFKIVSPVVNIFCLQYGKYALFYASFEFPKTTQLFLYFFIFVL